MNKNKTDSQEKLESIFKQIHIDTSFDNWVTNFALNLSNIWNEKSARNLDPSFNSKLTKTESAIVIGAGPSLKKHNHLDMLANSDYRGTIICTDRSLVPALKSGITPKKFPNFYVLTIDTDEIIKKFYEDKIISEFGSSINGIFTTVTHNSTINEARNRGINIHWIHALFDYQEGKKSFNQISGMMVKAKNHLNGLPAIQTGGNVGTSAWFVGWRILHCSTIALIGIDHSWSEDESWEKIFSYYKISSDVSINDSNYKKLFPIIHNPEFNTNCKLDPVFQYYSNALKEFILRSPKEISTINATEGGCIFGERITCLQFSEFLKKNNC